MAVPFGSFESAGMVKMAPTTSLLELPEAPQELLDAVTISQRRPAVTRSERGGGCSSLNCTPGSLVAARP